MKNFIILILTLGWGSNVFSQDTTTLLFSNEYYAKERQKQELVVIIHGKIGRVLKPVVKAARKSEGNIKILRVKNTEDAADQVEKMPGKITRLFFLSHGDAKNDNRAFFSIGKTFLHSEEVEASSALMRIAHKLESTPGPLPSAAQVIVFACGSGGTHNGGVELLAALAQKLHATVFGAQGFAMVNSSIFNRSSPGLQDIPVKNRNPQLFSHALQNHGNWTKVYEFGSYYKAETIENVYFDTLTRIHYTLVATY